MVNREMSPKPDTQEDAAEAPNCFRCSGFVITHDPAFPYACRHFAFRSRNLPSREIEQASGQPCLLFRRKPLRDG